MKFKMEYVNINDLKPDPNQPRKKFDKDAINNLAKTIHGHKIINPIEADENNVIITGELRWRAGKEAGQEKILIKRIFGLEEWKRRERQLIENIHHNKLSDKELREALERQVRIGKYKDIDELAERVGLSDWWAKDLLRYKKAAAIIGKNMAPKLKTTTVLEIDRDLTSKVDKQKLAKKAIEKKLRREDVREIIKTIKEVPKDVKEEILKPKSEITIEEAKEVAEFPEPEQRKQVIEQIKRTKLVAKKIINEQKKIVKKEAPPRIVEIPPINERQVKKWQDLYFQITQQFNVENLLDYSQETQLEGIKIMQKAYKFIFKEVNRYGERV